MINKVKFLSILFFLIMVKSFGQSKTKVQSYMLSNTEVQFLKSTKTQIDYKLYVSLPDSYKSSENKKYPVLYVLDADYSFAIAKNISEHLSQRNHLKELIVVRIAYVNNQYRINRTRDYTPSNTEENVGFKDLQKKYSGGGKNFMLFIEDELIPYVNKNYRANSFRAISGHSYGALFASWILLTNPDLFSGYIIVSPSLWYDNHLLFRIQEKSDEYSKSKINVYFTVGDREINNTWNMLKDLNDFVFKFKEKKLENIEIKYDVGKNETHNSIFPFGLSNGIRFVFDGI